MKLSFILRAPRRGAVRLAFVTLAALACADGNAKMPPSHTAHAARNADADSAARARLDSVNRATPGYVVDSILSPAEELRRFQGGIASRPEAFAQGAGSRDALVGKWARALEARDSVTLIRLAVNRPEFAYLVYPDSPLARPPYRQPPATSWLQLSNASVQGFRRSLVRLGGKPLAMLSYACAPEPERQGGNLVWSDCRVRHVRAAGDTVERRLFGPIIERDGRFKFLSLANDI